MNLTAMGYQVEYDCLFWNTFEGDPNSPDLAQRAANCVCNGEVLSFDRMWVVGPDGLIGDYQLGDYELPEDEEDRQDEEGRVRPLPEITVPFFGE